MYEYFSTISKMPLVKYSAINNSWHLYIIIELFYEMILLLI